ncbi:MAG: Fmu (Sun) domain-containing protein [Bacteroidetes bacterium]|nr:MAG: Fmu (Sun) domain-containing protein [Bacteroidota bacterium]
MSRYHSYLNSAIRIIEQYKGEEPFASFLKKHFAANKKYGSKDRKQIAHLCYCCFRLGKTASGLVAEERFLTALFLCSDSSNEILTALKPEWNEKVSLPVEEKCSILNIQFSASDIFQWNDELSSAIDHEKFARSFLTQPDLFLRIRPGQIEIVLKKLESAGVQYQFDGNNCISLSNSTKLEDILGLDKEVVIQDYSSQQIGEFLKLIKDDLIPKAFGTPLKVWDCCAASGGKSILVKDILGELDLTVSDIRESILANLKKRFNEAGITKYRSVIADLTASNIRSSILSLQPSVIIADVPCSGSGTWARTPEQLTFFKTSEIERYSSLQKKIISNTITQLMPGGYFLYITCSVFKNENEENVEFIKKEFHLDLIKMELLKGYDKKADTMFAALFRRSL